MKGADEVLAVAEVLRRAGVRHRLVVETEGEWAGQAMAVGAFPGRKEDLRKHFASIPLLK